jgi:hypothetical protein
LSERARGRWRRWAWVAIALAALAVVAGRVLHDSWSALTAGEDAERRGDGATAVRQYLHAARMYVPGSPFVQRALDRLQAIAASAEAAGDLATARSALEAIRAALLGSRSFYTPHAGRLPTVNRRLAAIYARTEDLLVAPASSLEEREAWHLARLTPEPGPAPGPAAAALVGLGLWLSAAVTFLRRGVDRSLKLQRAWALASGLAFLLGFGLFVVGLRLA